MGAVPQIKFATILSIGIFVFSIAVETAHAEHQHRSVKASCNNILVFVTTTCPHCKAAKEYLQNLQSTYPQLDVQILELDRNAEARSAFKRFNKDNGITQPGVPTFSVCGEIILGFDEVRLSSLILNPQFERERFLIEVPLFGDISIDDFGLPLFTVVLGLIDGFNPCAMWVLLFLLSILVHVKKRSRILLIAGTFVFISGAVYFAFMAAWLNVFFILGYSRLIHIVLGIIAIAIGSIHIKDYVAYGRGISLSIPASAKPKIYQRVRNIVNAENTFLAIACVAILAVLVNFLELICTAGLPALYTQILSQHELQRTGYYAYLALYNLAYIVDDGIMVAIAVVTLGQRKLQESTGRWLKLLSGLIIGSLGVVLIIAPQWLAF